MLYLHCWRRAGKGELLMGAPEVLAELERMNGLRLHGILPPRTAVRKGPFITVRCILGARTMVVRGSECVSMCVGVCCLSVVHLLLSKKKLGRFEEVFDIMIT